MFRRIGLERPRDWIANFVDRPYAEFRFDSNIEIRVEKQYSQLCLVIGAVRRSHADSTRSRYAMDAIQLRQLLTVSSRNRRCTKHDSRQGRNPKYEKYSREILIAKRTLHEIRESLSLSLSLSHTHSHTFATLTLTYTTSHKR